MEYENWKNIPKVSDFIKDYKSALPYHNDRLRLLDRYERLKNESKVVISKKGTKRRKSTYRSLLIKKQFNWIIPRIENAILSQRALFSLSAKSGKAAEFTSKNNRILNHQWLKDINRVELINTAVRNYVEEGSCVLKVGWLTKIKLDKVIEEIAVFTDNIDEIRPIIEKASNNIELQKKLIEMYNSTGKIISSTKKVEKIIKVVEENRPRPEVRDNRAIIIDPSAKGMWSKVKFLIDIQETDWSSLKSNNSYFNLDHVKEYVKSISDGYNEYLQETMTVPDFKDNFQFSDLARKKITMFEYWGYWDINGDGTLVSIVAAWIGGKLVRLERNPLSHNEIPYAISAYNPIKNEFWGEPDSVLLEDDQKGLSGVMRAMQDITQDNAMGQEFIDTSIFESPTQRVSYENGETVIVRKDADIERAIYKRKMEPVPNVMFDMKGLYNEHSTQITGVMDMDGGPKQMGQTISGSPMPLDPATNREMEVLRRFLSMLERYGKLTLSMNKSYLLPSAYIDDGETQEQIGDINDLKKDYKVEIDVSTLTINNDKASKIMYLLHNNGVNMSPRVAALHYAKTAKLWGLEDLSQSVMDEVNAPPSEEQMMMQKLELERVQLENNKVKLAILTSTKEMEFKDAKIAELINSIQSGSINADIDKKIAETELLKAQADKAHVQVDLFDQEFKLIDDGTKRLEFKQDKEYQHAANLEREKVRTDRELALEEKKSKDKDNQSSKDKNVDYIRNGTLFNNTYDPSDDIFRNIREDNSLDTSEAKDKLGKIEKMPSAGDFKDMPTNTAFKLEDNTPQQKDK